MQWVSDGQAWVYLYYGQQRSAQWEMNQPDAMLRRLITHNTRKYPPQALRSACSLGLTTIETVLKHEERLSDRV